MSRCTLFPAVALAVLMTGCASPMLYSWGSYEDQLYTMYAKPGAASPEDQIARLEADFEKAKASNKPVPPGFHAHLGYMYAQIGKSEEARRQFESEKRQFPESAALMDRLLANLK